MWAILLHTLDLLNKLIPSKENLKWTEIKQKGFEEIKRVGARNNLLIDPDFNKGFEIKTNARNFKLVVVVIQ